MFPLHWPLQMPRAGSSSASRSPWPGSPTAEPSRGALGGPQTKVPISAFPPTAPASPPNPPSSCHAPMELVWPPGWGAQGHPGACPTSALLLGQGRGHPDQQGHQPRRCNLDPISLFPHKLGSSDHQTLLCGSPRGPRLLPWAQTPSQGPAAPKDCKPSPAPAPRGARKGVGVSGQQGGRERRSVRRSPGWAVRVRRPLSHTVWHPPLPSCPGGRGGVTQPPGLCSRGEVSPRCGQQARRWSDGLGRTASLPSRCETRETRALARRPLRPFPGDPALGAPPGPLPPTRRAGGRGLSFPGIGRPLVPTAAPAAPSGDRPSGGRAVRQPGSRAERWGRAGAGRGEGEGHLLSRRRRLCPGGARRGLKKADSAPARPAPPRGHHQGEARGRATGLPDPGRGRAPLPGGAGPVQQEVCAVTTSHPVFGARGPSPKADRDRVWLPPIVQGLLLIGSLGSPLLSFSPTPAPQFRTTLLRHRATPIPAREPLPTLGAPGQSHPNPLGHERIPLWVALWPHRGAEGFLEEVSWGGGCRGGPLRTEPSLPGLPGTGRCRGHAGRWRSRNPH